MPQALTNTGNKNRAINSVRIDVARAGVLSLIGLSNTEIAGIEGTDRNAIARRLLKVPDRLYDVPTEVLAGAVKVMNSVSEATQVLIVLMNNEDAPASVRASIAFGIYDRSVGYIQQQQANQDKQVAKDKGDDDAVFNQAEINSMARQHLLSIGQELAERKAKDKANRVEAKVVEPAEEDDDVNEKDDNDQDEGGGTPK